MTPPRQVLPDTAIEITQRTIGRAFRFLPQREISQLVLYVLGVAASRYDIGLYGFALLVTHYHLAILDRLGNFPEFVQYMNSLIARAMNTLQSENDKLWSGSGYVAVRPHTGDDLLRKIVYGLANPAAAGLVNRLEDFPGLVLTPDDIGRTIEVDRPRFFFREDGVMPDKVTLRFEIPPAFEHLGLDGYRKLLWEQLREKEREHRVERRAAGRSVVGRKRLMQAGLGQRSTSWERWFTMRPTIAAKLRADRIAAILALRSFRASYREAWRRWRGGEREVTFPVGSWWLPRYAGATTG